MPSAPALTAVHEALQQDARLVQLKLQYEEGIIRGRGHADPATVRGSGLLGSLTSSSVLHVHRQQSSAGNAMAPNIVLEAVQQEWQKLMHQRLHAAQLMLPDIPLVAAPRPLDELSSLQDAGALDAWRQIGNKHSPFVNGAEAAPGCIKLLYGADDLLEALLSAVDVAGSAALSVDDKSSLAGACSTSSDTSTSSTAAAAEGDQQQQVQLTLLQSVHAPGRVWLQSFFAELQPDRRQVGLDDILHPWYHDQQIEQARSIAASCSAAACKAAARTGVPASERPWVWATALGLSACMRDASTSHHSTTSNSTRSGTNCQHQSLSTAGCERNSWWQLPTPQDCERLQVLSHAVMQQALLVDVLTCADVQETADSAHFFVFEEAMRAVLLAFSRDASVTGKTAVPTLPSFATASISTPQQPLQLYPASGIMPFQGLSAYLAPLYYLYSSPAALYPVWHAMYCQFWCYLHTLNSSSAPAAGLPVLCRTFLDLMQEVDAELYHHLCSLTASPLDLVMPWLLTAFAMHLAPTETLLLWDRIIGFDSLLPLPVLAVAILTFRRDLVLAAVTSEEVAELLQDLGQLRVVPLLQALLFDTEA